MKIGIDARMYGLEHAGIGRYVKNLTHHIFSIDKKNKYVLFLNNKYYKTLKVPKNVDKVKADIKHYSLKEQLKLPKIIESQNVDLMHFPHFNVPLIYDKPFVVTIHDLLWHKTKGFSVTSLSPLKYTAKYLGYRSVVNHALAESKKIIAPSEFVKEEITNYYSNRKKITVTYEGVDSDIAKAKAVNFKSLAKKFSIKTPFIVYIGSAYPHKNLKKLIDALCLLNINSEEVIQLVIISSRNIFLDKIKAYAQKVDALDFITFTGFLSDEQVKSLYQKALALIHPSKSEGFGLTGLEAMAVGVPVISSVSASLPEIYDDAAEYIDPDSAYDIALKIQELNQNNKIRKSLIKKGKKRVNIYSWEKTAKQTLKIYKKACK